MFRLLAMVILCVVSSIAYADIGIPVLTTLDNFTQKTIDIYQNSYGWLLTINVSIAGTIAVSAISHLHDLAKRKFIVLVSVLAVSIHSIAIWMIIEMQDEVINQLSNHFFNADALIKPSCIVYVTLLGGVVAFIAIGNHTRNGDASEKKGCCA